MLVEIEKECEGFEGGLLIVEIGHEVVVKERNRVVNWGGKDTRAFNCGSDDFDTFGTIVEEEFTENVWGVDDWWW